MSDILFDIFRAAENPRAHDEFIKYGRGVFRHKYLLEGKKQKAGWAIKTGPEFANYLVRVCLERAKGEVAVTGIIVATFSVADKAAFPIASVKKYMGIQQAIVNTTTTPDNILSLMEAYPRAFFALSFTTPVATLKIKAKPPKGAKPAASGEKAPAAEFCSLKTSDATLIKTLFFDHPDFSRIAVHHTLTITDIVLPKGVSDPVQLREQSKRKGTITRVVTIEEKESTKEAAFFA